MLQPPTLVKTKLTGLSRPLEEINEFETAIENHARWDSVTGLGGVPFIKVAARFVRLFGLLADQVLRFVPLPIRERNYLSIGYIAPHYLIYKTFPYFCIPSGLRIVWMYDAWQNQLEAIASAMRLHRINICFISSLQASEYLDSLGIENFRSFWLPEAVTVSSYESRPYSDRDIDILQLGRRWDEYHNEIEAVCRKNGWSYLYEKKKGEIIFPTREAFVEGLANSKISICVPSAITHPARSGRISTMTWRYVQSMASKCLILGKAPDEMKQLFDYEPIIEIDMNNPRQQLRDVLARYFDYIPLIERNYAFVQRNHQWQNRIDLMQSCLVDFEKTTRFIPVTAHKPLV